MCPRPSEMPGACTPPSALPFAPSSPPCADEAGLAAADFDALTSAQYRFLLTFLPDLRAEEENEPADMSCEAFVERVLGMDFDGWESDSTLRVARNLNRKGMFSRFEEHQNGLLVMFSRRGAQLLFNILKSWSQ